MKPPSSSPTWPEPEAQALDWGPHLELVLASGSPQRREILSGLGISFEVDPAGIGEIAEGEPAAVALENARLKAREVVGRRDAGSEVVLAADTVVAAGDRIIDKPADAGQAALAIERLAGREHDVWGGVVVAGPGDQWREGLCRSGVRFRPLGPGEISDYVALGEWEGRAGGYAIQLRGGELVEAVEGDRENVIGLSTTLLAQLVQGLVPSGGTAPDRYNH